MKTIPFDIEKAKAGAKVVTRNGTPIRIICFDRPHDKFVIVGLTPDGFVLALTASGKFLSSTTESDHDAFIVCDPEFRAWKAEEVPIGSQVRCKKTTASDPIHRSMILAVARSGINVAKIEGWIEFEYCLKHWEYSTDNGKTWCPCGVEE